MRLIPSRLGKEGRESIVRLALDLDHYHNPITHTHSQVPLYDSTTGVKCVVLSGIYLRSQVQPPLPASCCALRDISIQPIILPLQELLLDQPIDIPLDPTDLQRAPIPRRLDRLRHQLCMANPLPRLQDAHNSRLRFVVAVRGNALVGFFVLSSGFFELHCVDLDAVFWVREGGVEREGVGGSDFAAFGVLG